MKNIIIVVCIVGSIVLGYLFVVQNNNQENGESSFSIEDLFGSREEQKEEEQSPETSSLEEVSGDTLTASGNSELPITYQNQQFGFELNLPEDYTGSSFQEGNGVTVLLQKADGSESFQMYVQPFEETQSVTIARIKQDVPGLVIENPQNAIIAGGSIEALIFVGESEDFGKTREVWFVKNENLFQVIAPFEMEETIGPIVESLRFQ